MAKRTPYPWKYERLDEPKAVIVKSEIRNKYGSFVIAYPFSTVEDAQVITVAPEMLDMLIQLVELRGQINYDSIVWDEVQALIAKAKGGGNG